MSSENKDIKSGTKQTKKESEKETVKQMRENPKNKRCGCCNQWKYKEMKCSWCESPAFTINRYTMSTQRDGFVDTSTGVAMCRCCSGKYSGARELQWINKVNISYHFCQCDDEGQPSHPL
jgi:hypothetical protein